MLLDRFSVSHLALSLISFLACAAALCEGQVDEKPFTVADEVGLTLFGNRGGAEPDIHFSPDGNYFAVWSERGRLDLNRPEDTLRFYRSQDIESFLGHSNAVQPPLPTLEINRSTYTEGPIIKDWRWLADSSGVALLERTATGSYRLVLADLRKKAVEPLTSEKEFVKAFDIRDREHFAYSVVAPIEQNKRQAEREAPAIVGTERDIHELIFPDNGVAVALSSRRRSLLAVVGGRRSEVVYSGWFRYWYSQPLALSPDGGSLVTTLPVPEVPSSWEILYPPPFASSVHRVRAGQQDPRSNGDTVYQYVRINLRTGSVQPLTDAPISNAGGWWAAGSPSWSNDGQEILLPDTFLSSTHPSSPCVAVVDLPSKTRTCVEMFKGQSDGGVQKGYGLVKDARFASGDRQRVIVTFIKRDDQSVGTTEYLRGADGAWHIAERKTQFDDVHNSFEITVKQSLNEPPLLVATNKQTSRVIWDPNPQLKNIELGQARVYKWKDKEGRKWSGGLFEPIGYKPGERYPLVIQTHGFYESEFRPSGIYPTAFAARALAASGIVVLQVAGGVCPVVSLDEGPCNAQGFESGARRLVSEGLVDPGKIGIIGFSRTCLYVMEMLTTSSLHLKAASITDGIMGNYFQYLMWEGYETTDELDAMIGAPPFGGGLQRWLKRSVGFNLDKVTTPLLVVGEGKLSLLSMWEPYAGLHHLHKPVELIMLNTDEHVLTNPAARIASQGGSVDWFRFWLQDHEDPDPAKAAQYARWHELRKLQEAQASLTLPAL